MSDTGMNETSWLNRIGRWLAIATEWQKEQDHAAERRFWDRHMERHIRAATWLNILTGAAAVTGLIGLLFVYLTLREAKDSTVWANRAWIAPTGIEQDKQTPGEVAGRVDVGAELPIRIYYNNVGKGPALKVSSYFTPKIAGRNAMGGINNSCEEGSEGSSSPGVVFQNSGKQNWWAWKIPAKYITQEVIDGAKDLIVQGCTTYLTMNEPHKTWFCYVVLWDKKLASPDYSPFCGDGQDAN
jgi:hypothetical protein